MLMGFDKPFNQAPSLHIALLVVIWVMFARHTRGLLLRGLLHGWMALIGLSVLTTWQHHFIDVPTGALAGWLCVWLWPIEDRSPLHNLRLAREPQRWRLALRYGLGSADLRRPGGQSRRRLAVAAVALRIAAAGGAELRTVRRGRFPEARRRLAEFGQHLAIGAPSARRLDQLATVDASTASGSGGRRHLVA